MESIYEYSRINFAFGVPFYSMDFSDFSHTVETLTDRGGKHLIFTASMPWLLDFAKNALLCPRNADYILAADSNLITMAAAVGTKIKMPLEYFEFPEQVARVCAHFGFSMMHISETDLKTDILVSDGYVPLSWELFTHFKLNGPLDDIDARSIVDSAKDSKPKIMLIAAAPASLARQLPKIYEQLHDCIIICIPQDTDRNKIAEKIDNVFSPLLLIKEEREFLKEITITHDSLMSPSVSYDSHPTPAVINIIGEMDARITPEIIDTAMLLLEQGHDIHIDLSATQSISQKGFEALYFIFKISAELNKKLTLGEMSPRIVMQCHQSGLSYFIENISGVHEGFHMYY